MLRPLQPLLFQVPAEPKPIAERLRTLALIANAACIDTAGMVAQAAGVAWWESAVASSGGDPHRLPPPPPPIGKLELPATALAEAEALGHELARRPISEANGLLGRLYTQALPQDHRTAKGVFYTPPSLADHLLGRATAAGFDWQSGRVLDPSCGAGAFLIAAGHRMLTALPGADPAIVLANIGSRLRGWDIDPIAAWLAQLSVELLLLPQTLTSTRRLAPVTLVGDALIQFESGCGGWDLVMGNPPFGKVKDTPALRDLFRRSLHGHPNLYGLFFDVAVHLAKPAGGVIAYLTPASFLAGQYFRNLRRLLQEKAPPVFLDVVESRTDVFEDVLQEVVLSVSRCGGSPAEAGCSVVHVSSNGLCIEPTGRLHLSGKSDEPWLLPRRREDAGLVARLRSMPTRLSDWGYEVCTGPLVWNRHKERLHDTAKARCVPVVWAESVTPDGRFSLSASKRNHRAWYQPRDSGDPNIVRQSCILVQRTTAKEQHRRLIAAEMPATLLKRHGAVAVENHLNMIRPITRRPEVPSRVVAAFLATEIADRVFRCISGSVAVSATELAAMPLPRPEAIMRAVSDADFETAVSQIYGASSK